MIGVQLFSLSFAKIGDLLHDLSASRHPIHRGSHSREKRHEALMSRPGPGMMTSSALSRLMLLRTA
jgi:hypothetical protein